MPRSSDEPTSRIHLHIFTSDLEFIKAHYGTQGNIGQNAAMRMMIRRVVNLLKAEQAKSAQPVAVDVERALAEESAS